MAAPQTTTLPSRVEIAQFRVEAEGRAKILNALYRPSQHISLMLESKRDMDNIKDLRERLVGRRFYDKQEDEGFTVVGITSAPPMALLQYDDGVAWDEGAANFTFDEDVAHMANLDEDGLDSDRYRQLGPGPRIDQICEPEEHDWFPWPDDIWQGISSDNLKEQVPSPSRDFYSRFARCKRCGLSGSVAGQFGEYVKRGNHYTPWFCYECGEAHSEHKLHYIGDLPYCPECTAEKNEKGDN